MNENILNPKLYKKAKSIADKKYERHSAYKSMFIQKKYIELGGKYKRKGKKLSNWRKEEWVEITPYLKENKKIVCGSSNNKKGCRPLKRINKDTPITIGEMLKKHKKEDILRVAEKKKKKYGFKSKLEYIKNI